VISWFSWSKEAGADVRIDEAVRRIPAISNLIWDYSENPTLSAQ